MNGIAPSQPLLHRRTHRPESWDGGQRKRESSHHCRRPSLALFANNRLGPGRGNGAELIHRALLSATTNRTDLRENMAQQEC